MTLATAILFADGNNSCWFIRMPVSFVEVLEPPASKARRDNLSKMMLLQGKTSRAHLNAMLPLLLVVLRLLREEDSATITLDVFAGLTCGRYGKHSNENLCVAHR